MNVVNKCSWINTAAKADENSFRPKAFYARGRVNDKWAGHVGSVLNNDEVAGNETE